MTISGLLSALPRKSALVVGDVCLDRWATYDPSVSEPSRETGIPRLGVISTEVTPGAGGTVANNLAALGVGRVAVAGVCGDDGFAFELRRALEARSIETDLLAVAPGTQTFTYTKVINAETGVEDQPRLDFISTKPLPEWAQDGLLDSLRGAAPAFDVILIADQAETEHGGVVTPAVRDLVATLAREMPDKVFWADSRIRADRFRNVIVKPNQHEAALACERLFGRPDYQALRRHIGSRLLVVTHGEEGVLLISDGGEEWVRARRIGNPVDICGAGDSFTAGAAMALSVTGCPAEAARFGNLVASITVMKKGTGTASPAEVLAASGQAAE